MHAAGHQVVARALGRAHREHGCFHLHKAPRVQKFTHALENFVPQEQIVLHRLPADVQIAILHPQLFGNALPAGGFRARHHGLIGNRKRRRIGFSKNRQITHRHFEFPGFDMGVLRAGVSFFDFTGNGDAVFRTQRRSRLADSLRSCLRIKHNLHNAAAVAQMNKNQTAVIAVGVHPAAKLNALADLLHCQFAAKNPLGKAHEIRPF